MHDNLLSLEDGRQFQNKTPETFQFQEVGIICNIRQLKKEPKSQKKIPEYPSNKKENSLIDYHYQKIQ